MTYRSEIRDSQIRDLLGKVAKGSYKTYLRKLTLNRVRGFSEQVVRFDFPVTALIGPNGGGKTTILGAAACAYKSVKPQRFFAKSGRLDGSMKDWRIEYELIDKDVRREDVVRRTASFKQKKWNRDALDRAVIAVGISRTVPANERAELRRCASNQFQFPRSSITPIGRAVSDAVGKILGKDASNYTHVKVDQRGRVSLLAGRTKSGNSYSEFHFGAGESSVIRMITQIEAQPEGSLILIEEIENGLHPVATRRMVEYLIDVAMRKKSQAVFTTHSDDALAPLPPEAIWAALDGRVVQGKLSIESLRAITGDVDAQCVVFTEDEFASQWIRSMIRTCDEIGADAVEVYGMQGDGTAVLVNRVHNIDPSSRRASVCFVDGDSQQSESTDDGVYRLPGESPERFIYGHVHDSIKKVKGTLAVALHQSFDAQDRVEEVVRDVWQTNRDPHLLYSQVGFQLGFISEEVVREAFLFVWTSEEREQVQALLRPVLGLVRSSGRPPRAPRDARRARQRSARKLESVEGAKKKGRDKRQSELWS